MMKIKLPSGLAARGIVPGSGSARTMRGRRSPVGSRVLAPPPPPPHGLSHWADTVFVIAAGCRDRAAPPESPVVSLWARSAGIALACAIFASALLGSASVWSQSQSAPILSFAATPTFAIEGGDDIELRIGLLLSHVSSRVDMVLTGSGTAVLGLDYSIVVADPDQGIMLGDASASTIALSVDSAPAEPLRLLLRPRTDDGVNQEDRLLNLRLSSYRVISAISGEETIVALPDAALELTIRDDEAPTAQQLQLGVDGDFICFLLNGGSLRCTGDNTDGRATPPDDLAMPPDGPARVAQLAVGRFHSCAATVSGQVRCWGNDGAGQSSPPEELGPSGHLGPVAQVSLGDVHSCALTAFGQLHCWGYNGDGRSSPPDGLRPVTQLGVGNVHSCVLTVAERVHCWGYDGDGRSSPPDDLGAVAQLAVGPAHSCALTASGRVRCWGSNHQNQATPPADLNSVAQLVMGEFHSCALTASGRVRCWGGDGHGQATPPDGLGAVVQLSAGNLHSCALAASGQLRCWGAAVDISLLPPIVAAIDASGVCALLADGSVLCPGRPELVPPGLRPSEVLMSVLPQQLNPGQRAAIRFVDLGANSVAFTARIEVIGDGEADVSSAYRLVDSNGRPLSAEPDGSYLIAGGAPNSPQPAGNPPTVWLEALAIAQPVRLYVRPLELVPASGSPPSIRGDGQPVELGTAPFLVATADTLAEGGEGAQLSIWLPLAHTGLRVELELTLSGTARADSDYILSATDPEQGIMFGGDANPLLTLRVESAPAEPLRLFLRQRADDRIYQGNRSLNLRLSRYRVIPEGEGTVILPPALDFTIVDNEEEEERLSVQLRVRRNGNFACVLLSDGAVRCGGNDTHGRATPPEDLPPVAQLGVGNDYACALTISGELHCWGNDADGRSSPPGILGPFSQLAVGVDYSCAVTVFGELHCWGSDTNGRSSPPKDLGSFAQLAVGESHSCAVTVAGRVHCWGSNTFGQSSPTVSLGPVAQVAVGSSHSCALTISGELRCWGSNFLGQLASPEDSLGPFAELVVGRLHSCAVTVAGQAHCWGFDFGAGAGRATPPEDLGPVTQLSLGELHSCAVTVAGVQRCWGKPEADISSLPPGAVTAIDASGVCVFLAEGSVYCPDDPQLIPPELAAGDVLMEVLPQRLNPGERAAIRFTDLRKTAAAFTARIEIFGDGDADVSSYYRLLDGDGQPLDPEEDANSGNSGNSVQFTGNPPMVWLEALVPGRGSRLYVRPLELLSASGSPLSIRTAAHPVELLDGPFLTASTATVTEGAAAVELSILLPAAHAGRQLELELTVSGTALAGADYTLAPAPGQGIVLAGGSNSTITLSVEFAPAERLRLLLQIRADDRIVQGTRFLNLRLSGYSVMPEIGRPTELPPVLNIPLLDDEPPTVQQLRVGKNGDFACVLLSDRSVRCAGNDAHGRATPPDDLPPVAQLGLGVDFGCALTVSGELRCWGSDEGGRSSPPDGLGPVAQLAVADRRSCALTVAGALRCWGLHIDILDRPRALPPDDLPPVVQVAVGDEHSCAVTVSGKVRCWGNRFFGQSDPPANLEQLAQVGVGDIYSCALTTSGELHCWGSNANGRTTPPNDLGPVVQLAVGGEHNCALTVEGRVRCWGKNDDGQAEPPDDLGPAVQLAVGENHSCALTVSGGLRCWGDVPDISSLPPGAVTAVDFYGRCALLADGSVVCPGRPQLVPPEQRAGDVVMAVWPQRLNPGERAAIRFADLRETTTAFTVRIEVFGGGTADVSSYYRLLSSTGTVLVAEGDANSPNSPNSPQLAPNSLAGNSLTGNPPMAWLEASGVSRFSRLYVRPLELLPASDSTPSIRVVTQSVELIDGLSFTASTATLTEGGEAAQLSIVLPAVHAGLQLELELAIGGTALAGADYTLVAAPGQGIVLGGEATDKIMLRVESIPAEPLRLLLQIRAADNIYQGQRSLTLRISRYQVTPEAEATVDLPPVLDFIILDDEPLPVQQVQVVGFGDFACVLLSDRSVDCTGDDTHGRATPPEDLGSVAQLSVGLSHSCAVTVAGRVHCWGLNTSGQSSPPNDLGQVAQVGVGQFHSCALTVSGQVRCWGGDGLGQSTPPEDSLGPFAEDSLGPFAEVVVGGLHSCALTVSGQVRCWGADGVGQSSPPDDLGPVAQIGVGVNHSCAVTVSGKVRCWGDNSLGQSPPPEDLGPVAQIGVGGFHSCALTVAGRVRCWGHDASGQSSPPDDLGPVAQVVAGDGHSCALTISGELRCWGSLHTELSSLPPGAVKAVAASGVCALLADGSVVCPANPELVSAGLAPSDVVMGVSPQRLNLGERAAIRFFDLRNTTETFTVRIEVIGDGDADVSSAYRLLSSTGTLLVAEPGANSPNSPNSPQLAGNSLAGNSLAGYSLTGDPPMAWLEYLGTAQSSRLYVLPLDLLSASGSASSIRVLAQPVELVAAPFLSVSSDTLTEGGEGIQLSIWLPQEHIGLPLELELTVGGTVLAGSDFTLVAAASTPRVTLAGEATDEITLRVESAPAEPLRLLLRPRADDSISQGDRLLQLRISRYQVTPEAEGTVDLPPPLALTIVDDDLLTAQQITGDIDVNFVCVLLTGGSVRCAGSNGNGESTPPDDLEPVVQLRSGAQSVANFFYTCALTVSGRVRCWGSNFEGQTTPPEDALGPFVQLALGHEHNCALTAAGEVHCWGFDGDGKATPPDNLGAVAQVGLGELHSCALTVLGRVRCWGFAGNDGLTASPADALGPFTQLVVGDSHNCALTVGGAVSCWGSDEDGQSTPPDGLGRVAQIGVGARHSCALTVAGEVHCWGYDGNGRSTPPDNLGPVVQLIVGYSHTCALTVSQGLRCWGSTVLVEDPILPPGAVTAVTASGACALLADGSVYCPDNPELVPAGLAPSEVVMAVSPRQLQPGQRAAIRFADLRETTTAFTARIEVFGDGDAYRLLSSTGTLLVAEEDANSVQLPGNPPMAWLEALLDGQGSRLYIRPSELLPESGEAPSIRMVAQPIELIAVPYLTASNASTDMLTEGGGGAQIDIVLSSAHAGRQLELELELSGTALRGTDYTLVAADPKTKITFAGDANTTRTITLQVESAPAEPLRLLLRPRADDRISQGDRLLNLRISRYQVVLASGETAGDLFPALDVIIRDNDPLAVLQVQVGEDAQFGCFLLSGGTVRCAGNNSHGRAMPPSDLGPDGALGPVAQLALGEDHACALTVSGRVRCWGSAASDRSTPPAGLAGVVQLAVGRDHSCALTVSGAVHCWGNNFYDQSSPPGNLPPVAQIGAGDEYSCALTEAGALRCWGRSIPGDIPLPGGLGAVAQLAAGYDHACAVTVAGTVHCWRNNGLEQSEPPTNLGPVAQVGVGDSHSCALTVSGQVRCWGNNANDRAEPPSGLGAVAQLAVGDRHSCARTVSGRLRCWGAVLDISSLPLGSVTAVEFYGFCALLSEGSVLCPGHPELVPPQLRPGEVVISVQPRQLLPGQRAAIRFVKLGNISGSLTARIEIFGDGTADVGSYYRLLDNAGTPLGAETDGSYRLTGNPPMAWLEALPAGQGSRLYVRPSELLRASGEAPSIRMVAQPIELLDGLFLLASADTLSEGGEALQLSIVLPAGHAGLRVELVLAAAGSALAGSDYTLVAADPAQGISLSGGATGDITLRMESAPAEALRLLLRSRGADSIGQGPRLLNLRISRYQVFPESAETVDLPAALDFSIADDEPLTVQQLQLGPDGDFACVLLNGGSVSCVGDNTNGRATPPDDLGGVTQLAVGMSHSCAVTVAGTVRCWGANGSEQSTPPVDLDQVVHVAVGGSHSCALTALGAVYCWGSNTFNQATPPDSLGPDGALGPVAEIGVGESHSCALTKGEDTEGAKSVKVRCWGLAGGNPDDSSEGGNMAAAANCTVAEDGAVTCIVADLNGNPIPGSLDKTSGTGALGPVTQLAVGGSHSCVVTITGRALCWGDNTHGQALAPPDVQGQTEELGLGASHSCARTISGGVRCWGLNEDGQTSSTVGLGPGGALGPAVQLEVGNNHGCARVESAQLHCWGDFATEISTLPPHVVTAVDAAGVCALLVDGSLYCPGNQELFPDELRQGDGVMSVLPRQLLFGERAAIRFANLRTDGAFTAQFEVFGDGTVDVSSAYRLLDSDGQPLVADPDDGSYEIVVVAGSPPSSGDPPATSGESPPPAWLESLVDGRSLFLYVRPLELLLNSGPELSIRQAAQRVELTTTLARLRVSVPAGELLPPPAQGTDTVTVDVRVEAMDAMDMPVNSTGLLLVAEPIAGSVRYWSPSVARPAVLSATDETGVFEGRLRIALDADNTAAELRIGVIGFQAQGIIVETAVVRVLQSLSFVAAASTTTEGADDLELQIGLPLGHVGRPVEIDLSIGGTALYDSDYTLVASETSGSVRFDETDSGVTLRLTDVPDTPLRLLLRPRSNDIIRQGDRRVELQLSGYRVTGDDERSADALPATLGVTILDRYLPVMQRLLGVASGAACVLLDEDNDDMVELRCWTVADAAAELRTVLAADDILSARQLAFGERHVCWLQHDRQVVCEGSDSSGQLNIPDLGTTPTVSVVAGRVESCAVDEDGAVRCWGEQSAGLPADLISVTQLSLGHGHGCALHADGVVSCWGDDTNGQATPPDNLGAVVQLALGYDHSCALQQDGQVSCWGGNMPPVDLGLATQLTSGARHSCALLADGTVLCWGANSSGQLSVPSLPPSGVKSLVAGGNSSCALLAEGSVRCWGGGLESAVPAELQPDDVAVSVLPQRLLVGQRAAIRFADLRGDREAPAVRIELLDDTARFGSDYRLVDAAGQPLSAEPDGRYLLAGNMQPAAYIESLPDTRGRALRTLHVLPLETVPAAGAAPSLRRAAQRVELVNPAAFAGSLVVQMYGGAERLLTADKMAPILLRLSLTNRDGSPLDEPLVLTVRLRGMLGADDAMLVPAEPFDVTASGIGVTTEVMVILGASGETTVQFTVSGRPPGAVVESSPTVLQVTLVSAPLDLDVTDDDSVGTEDVILLLQFMGVGGSGILPPALVPRQQQLEALMPPGVVDLRLDLDGDNTVDMIDLRIILRHLAGLRGAALGEGVEPADVEALFQPNP